MQNIRIISINNMDNLTESNDLTESDGDIFKLEPYFDTIKLEPSFDELTTKHIYTLSSFDELQTLSVNGLSVNGRLADASATLPPNHFLSKWHTIGKIYVDVNYLKNIDNVTLEIGGSKIAETKPDEDGNIIFWDDFSLSICDIPLHLVKIRIKMHENSNSDPCLYVLNYLPQYELPINIKNQNWCSPRLENAGYNNILSISHGMCGLKYD